MGSMSVPDPDPVTTLRFQFQAPLMDAEILDLSGIDLDPQYLRQHSQPHQQQQQQQQQHRLSCGSAFSVSPTTPSRRESTMSSDSGYHHMMTPLSADNGGGCSRRWVTSTKRRPILTPYKSSS